MAQSPPCSNDDGNPGVFIGSWLQTGDSAVVCVECLPYYATALAAQSWQLGVEQVVKTFTELSAEASDADDADEVAALQLLADAGDEIPPEPVSDALKGSDSEQAPDPTPPTRKSGRSPAGSSPKAADDGTGQPAETTTDAGSAPADA